MYWQRLAPGLVLALASGCLPAEFLEDPTLDPEPWGPPVACADTCPEGFECQWDRCQWTEMLALVNAARAESRRCGNATFAAVPALELAPPLTEAAQGHATHMANTGCFSHDTSGPRGCADGTACSRIANAGYRWRSVGENIAYGVTSAEDAVAGWLASPGHCANMMSPHFTHFGASVVQDPNGLAYVVQAFGAPGVASVAECQ